LVVAPASLHVQDKRKAKHMTARTLGGRALLASAVLTLVLFITMSAAIGGPTLLLVTGEALSALLIVGLVAIRSMLPHTGRFGRIGQIGLWCLGIAAGIAFVVRLVLLVSTIDVGDVVPFSSALFGLVGSLLVGWVTIRTQVFHPVIGWLLIVYGVLNLAGGLLPVGAGTTVMGVIGTLAQVGAAGGYGWTLLRSSRAATVTRPASLEPR
jgi:hypothetical protein